MNESKIIKAVYVHIPFCNNICSYCDFAKIYYNKKWINNYLDSLEKEIDLRYQDELIETIYIGGGTPSSLELEELEKLFKILKKIKTSYQEFTIEVNLDSLTKEKINLFKKYNINRVSIGIESFDQKNLTFLNRKLVNLDLINYLKEVGITNINVDLIYALPNESLKTLEQDLNKLLELDVPHISTYSLIIEPNTMISNMNPINEELDFKMYELICKKLENYNHYEISNFAKAGYEAKHNLTYWKNEQYYGFGMGASGYIGNIRYTNTRSITEYIAGFKEIEHDIVTLKTNMENEIILGLRLLNGVSISNFNNKFHKDLFKVFKIKELIEDKKLLIENDYLKINPKYVYTSNNILINFIGDENGF